MGTNKTTRRITKLGHDKMAKDQPVKREWDSWLSAINREFPDKGFDIIIAEKNNEFTMNFTPRHETPMIFFQTEKSVKLRLAGIYQTLQVLRKNQAIVNDKYI